MRFLTVVVLALSVSLGHADETVDCTDKVAVVTGGARGIGYAIAEELLKHGAKVVIIVDKNKSVGLKAKLTLANKYGEDRIAFVHGDVNYDLDTVCETIEKNWGIPDFLMNNAGMLNERKPVLTIQTNLVSTIRATSKLFEKARKDKGGKGCTIVNMSDAYNYFIDPFLPAYKAAYTGVSSYSETIGHTYNYLKTGVRVLSICLGFTKTQLTEGQMEIDERAKLFDNYSLSWKWQSPEDVAIALLNLLKTAKSGQTYSIDGGKYFITSEKINHSADYISQFEE